MARIDCAILASMDKLTASQKAVLSFIKAFQKEHGYAPTRTEISDNFGWSGTNAAACHLAPLARKGAIRIASNVARGIVVL